MSQQRAPHSKAGPTYYIRRGQKVIGPHTYATIKKSRDAGKLQGTDQISISEAGPWHLFGEIHESLLDDRKPLPSNERAKRAEPFPEIELPAPVVQLDHSLFDGLVLPAVTSRPPIRHQAPESTCATGGVQLTEQEVETFVGRKAEYYLQKWQAALGGEGFSEGFNWGAFLLPGLWFSYRKMYLPAAIFYGAIQIAWILKTVLYVGILGMPAAPAVVSRTMGLIAAVICGKFGNQWYVSHARKVIADVRSQGLPKKEYLRVLAERGGTNLPAALGFLVLFIALSFALNVATLMALKLLFARS